MKEKDQRQQGTHIIDEPEQDTDTAREEIKIDLNEVLKLANNTALFFYKRGKS